jgi:hypothetical protein
VWCTFQDACCETPSDYLDAGQSDLYVPTVPHGFIREVVIDEQSHARAVYYHYFEEVLVGPAGSRMVQRTALLRAAVCEAGVDAKTFDGWMEMSVTVAGFMLSNPWVEVTPKDFNFRTEALPSKAPPNTKAARSDKRKARLALKALEGALRAAEAAPRPAKETPEAKRALKAARAALKLIG